MELMKPKTEQAKKHDKDVAGLLSVLEGCLAESIDLMSQAKQAHWNVKCKNFMTLHLLFDELAEVIEKNADLIAERIVQLGGVADGTVQTVAKKSKLPMYPLHIISGEEHIANITNALNRYRDTHKQAAEVANEARDLGTADLLTKIGLSADKYYWMVSAHSFPQH